MQANPFWPNFVVDPRKIDPAWRPLFSEVLQQVSSEFDRRFPGPGSSWPHGVNWLERQPILLVGSNSSGAGVTTLIGTLFLHLEGKALPLYIRPFRNPLAPWRALLQDSGVELSLPDRSRAIRRWPEEPSRLQVFANDILGSLASQLVEQGRIRDSKLRSAVRFLRRHPSRVLLEGLVPEWAQWLRHDYPRIIPAAEELLSRLGLWEAHLSNWLWAIHGLAVRTEDRVIQEACRRWIFGEPVHWAQAIRANLAVAPGEQAMETMEDDEGHCRRRVEDLLRLSRLSKPFLLTFDNADAWGAEPALASSAGGLLQTLFQGPPAFLLLGAYLPCWNAAVLPHWPDEQRNVLSAPLLVREIKKPEAADFLQERIRRFERRQPSLRPEWIESAYQNRNSLPPRALLLSVAVPWYEQESADPNPYSICTRLLFDAKLQWEISLTNLASAWVVEWALLPLEPPADFAWQREEIRPFSLFCARRSQPGIELFVFPPSQTLRTAASAFLSFREEAADPAKAGGHTFEPCGLVFEKEEAAVLAGRNSTEEGSPGMPLLLISSKDMVEISAAVSLLFSFRHDPGLSSVEAKLHERAEGILASWRGRLPIPAPASPPRHGSESLSLSFLESFRDTIRAKRVIPLTVLLQRFPRQVTREQALSTAGILSEVQVRTGTRLEPLFCWSP
ncbi:hypothetical protein [Verrucomicrobium sp. 3C]|uniref:hypothetical protein n=1 Tax=Verrucomicrobium sp. 3C TaxID=1134055 RepID=UPI0003610A7F|nr:hypothetical protein [Verrucomicrobium sp. 3C]